MQNSILIIDDDIGLCHLLKRCIENVKLKLNDILETLDDIAHSNSNRKILAKPSDMILALMQRYYIKNTILIQVNYCFAFNICNLLNFPL